MSLNVRKGKLVRHLRFSQLSNTMGLLSCSNYHLKSETEALLDARCDSLESDAVHRKTSTLTEEMSRVEFDTTRPVFGRWKVLLAFRRCDHSERFNFRSEFVSLLLRNKTNKPSPNIFLQYWYLGIRRILVLGVRFCN
jgi:hypothetical protein